MPRPLSAVLEEGVARGVITVAQRDALQQLEVAPSGAAPSPEAPSGLSGVNIAYALGALLVLFACGWFLVNRWASLGGWGVLGVTLAYAAILGGSGWQLQRLGFPRAGGIAFMLAVSLAPLAAWSLMDLAGEWPRVAPNDAIMHYAPWMASRQLVLDLSTLLVALVTWRKRRFPALMLPIAVATWWTWFHASQLVERGYLAASYERWTMLAGALAVLAIADMVERWQRRLDLRAREGDYAGPLWFVGLVAFAISYLMLWGRPEAWKHTMPFVAMALLGLSLATGRRGTAFAGMLGVFGYLAYLASEVFKDGALFPLVLAALGILTIAATVWMQRRLPALMRRVSGEGRGTPWPVAVSWLPAVASLAMALATLPNADTERAQRQKTERDAIMRQHQDAQQGRGAKRPAVPAPRDSGAGKGA